VGQLPRGPCDWISSWADLAFVGPNQGPDELPLAQTAHALGLAQWLNGRCDNNDAPCAGCEHYVSSIILLADLARKYLPWLEPTVAAGPDAHRSPVHFRFRTQKRSRDSDGSAPTQEILQGADAGCAR
jgi:hypothetical protein